MKTTVEIQKPLLFSVWPIIILSILICSYAIYIIICKVIKKNKNKVKVKKVIVENKIVEDIASIKARYLQQLIEIENQLLNEKITVRAAYQCMSQCIRGFVNEVTGINVQNYTLTDIKMLNNKILIELITEYYSPEFAEKSVGEADRSIEKTKRAIERWN